MLSGNIHVLSTKGKLEGCTNFSSNTPQLGESPQSSGEVISSPRSPDYPPRVSISPHSPDTTQFTISMISTIANSTIMNTARCNEENADNVRTMHTDNMIEYNPLCSSPEKITNSQIEVTYIERRKQQEIPKQTDDMNKERKPQSVFDVKVESMKIEEELQIVKSEYIDDSFSKIISDSIDTEKPTESMTSSTSHSKNYSSSRERRSHGERRHCSRCYKRSKIKKASIGVQCKRDRNVLSSVNSKSISLSFPKSTNENLRLNLQTKSYKMLNNTLGKSELLEGLKYKKYIHIETYPNGGATVVHMYQDEIDNLSREQIEELAQEYFKVKSSVITEKKKKKVQKPLHRNHLINTFNSDNHIFLYLLGGFW